MDPLQFQFNIPDAQWTAATPNTPPAFTNSYIFAGSLLVSPVMNATAGATTFQAYFPQGTWVNMADFNEIIVGKDDVATLQVRDTVNAHLAPGSVISFQNNSDYTMMTTGDALAKPISLIANRDPNG
jgi:alpha-glucosidase (family GH31 glycosyl hydrolase)